jgi:hypothetical protein
MAVPFFIGRGASVVVAGLPDGISTEPITCIPTVAATAPAKAAVSITITALPVGSFIPSGSYLNFVDSVGYETVVQLSADAVGAATTLTVLPLAEAIKVGATATYPLPLRARTSADIGRQGKRITSFTFDTGGYEQGLNATLSNDIKLKGNWSPSDAGYATAERWFNEFYQQMYFWIYLPNPKPTVYKAGRIYKGPASISAMPLTVPADGIITGDIDAAFNGKPVVVDPAPLP